MARVSNPANQANPNIEALLQSMLRRGHWSPFEMVNACFEIRCTRAIAHQILRHRSFSFQEFSQRYAVATVHTSSTIPDARLKHPTDRQKSVLCDDPELNSWWRSACATVARDAAELYSLALDRGIAREVARVILPEGLTETCMYMGGNIRSWIHYCQLRTGNGTQIEHQTIAKEISNTLAERLPIIWRAAGIVCEPPVAASEGQSKPKLLPGTPG